LRKIREAKAALEAEARAIWNEMILGYPLFIKASALSYALISYQTAWLKTSFPEEFAKSFPPP